MSRRRSVAFIPVAVGALLAGLGAFSVSAAPPTGTDASEVTHWNQVAANTLVAFPGPNGGAPPAFQINMGMVQGAVYDAVNAIGPKKHRRHICSRIVRVRRRRSMPPSQLRRTTCSQISSRMHPRPPRSRVVRDS